jgi:Flp pilus assembly pilin Flp
VTGSRPQATPGHGFSTGRELPLAAAPGVENPQSYKGIRPDRTSGQQSGEVMHNTSLAVVRDDHVVRDEAGATTAEYATVTGCGVGFAAVLFKFLTSEAGQQFIKLIFNAIKALLPF